MLARKLLVVLGILSLAASAVAQIETGDLRGTVTDKDGKPIEAAEVILTGPSLSGERVEITTAQGTFTFLSLPVGFYAVDISSPGYQPQRYENVRTRLGESSRLTVKLDKAAAIEEEVVVTSRPPLVDTSTASAGVHLSADTLAALPVQARSVRELTKYAPSVTGTEIDVSGGGTTGQPSFRGQGQYGNNWMVDGLSVTDPRTKTIGGSLNFDALGEVNIITDPFEPQYGQALGGIVNVVTKRGSNEWDGEVAALIQPDFLTGDSFSNQVVVDERENYNYYFNLGGPVVKDHWWFFTSINQYDNQISSGGRTNDLAYAYDPTGNLLYQNYDLGLDIPRGTTDGDTTNAFIRMDFPINAYHNVYVTATFDDADTTGGAGALPETLSDFSSEQRRYRIDYKGVIKKNTALEFKAGFLRRDFDTLPRSFGPAQIVMTDITTELRNDYNNGTEERKRDDFEIDVTHYFEGGKYGNHQVRAGVLDTRAEIDDVAVWTGQSDIIFNTYPTDYEDPNKVGLPNPFQGGSHYTVEFVRDYVDQNGDTNPDDLNGDGTINDADLAVLTDPNGDPLVAPVVYEQIRSQRDLNSFDTLSAFVQDTWTIGRSTFMFGARADSQEVMNDVGRKVADFSLQEGIAARFSAQFDLTGDGANVLKVGAGRFVDLVSTRLGEFTNEQGGLALQNYVWNGPAIPWSAFANGAIPAAMKDPNNWLYNYEQSPDTAPAYLDPALRPNHANKYMLEYTHVWGAQKMAATVRGVWVQARDLIDDVADYRWQDLNGDGQLDDRNGDGQLTPRDKYLNYDTINWDGKKRDYKALELIFEGRPWKRLYMNASLVFSDDKGTSPGNFELGDYGGATGSSNDIGVFGDNPGSEAIERYKEIYPCDCETTPACTTGPSGRCRWYLFEGLGSRESDEGWYGKMPYAVDTQFKLTATVDLPKDFMLSGFVNWRTGYHWQKKGFQDLYQDYFTFPEGRGSRETPDNFYMDLGIAKMFRFVKRQAFGVELQLFNVLNSRTELSYVQEDVEEEFGNVFSKQDARSARLNLKYIF